MLSLRLSHFTLMKQDLDCDILLCFNFDCLTAGNVVCSWGRGEDGQLGHGDTNDRLLPTKLSAFDGQNIVSVTCGADYTVVRSESGCNVYSCGWYALYLNYIWPVFFFLIIRISFDTVSKGILNSVP